MSNGLEIHERSSEKTISTSNQTLLNTSKVILPQLRTRKSTEQERYTVPDSFRKSQSQSTNNNSSYR